MHTTDITNIETLPAPLRDLARRHLHEQHEAEDRAAEAARAALAQLTDDEPRRLLAVAARLRGEAEALRRKADDAQGKADAAHLEYQRAASHYTEQRVRLRHVAVAPHRLAEAYRRLEDGAEQLRTRYRLGRRSDRAALEAIHKAVWSLRTPVLDALRDGAADPPAEDLLVLVRETLETADAAAREAVTTAEAAIREQEARDARRRLFG